MSEFTAAETALVETALAKVNLSLRVLGRRPDGYHELESVVAFATTGDRLSLVPGPAFALETELRPADEFHESLARAVRSFVFFRSMARAFASSGGGMPA